MFWSTPTINKKVTFHKSVYKQEPCRSRVIKPSKSFFDKKFVTKMFQMKMFLIAKHSQQYCCSHLCKSAQSASKRVASKGFQIIFSKKPGNKLYLILSPLTSYIFIFSINYLALIIPHLPITFLFQELFFRRTD